ncbi:acetone carboxylase subunit gamma [Chloroflexota bacterium]
MPEEREIEVASRENLRLLDEGKLPWEDVKRLIQMIPKDKDRFWKYLEILKEKVPWKDRILLRLSDHLYIVRRDDGARVTKCDCGQEFGDYRVNWKLNCLVRVRKTAEEFAEVFTSSKDSEVLTPTPGIPYTSLVEVREFYCPRCLSQLAVEVVPVGYPIICELLPDLDSFYREILHRPLEDERSDWFQDKSQDLLAQWAAEE